MERVSMAAYRLLLLCLMSATVVYAAGTRDWAIWERKRVLYMAYLIIIKLLLRASAGQVTHDGSRVGNEDVDLIYQYNPVINQGYFSPQQVRRRPCRPSLWLMAAHLAPVLVSHGALCLLSVTYVSVDSLAILVVAFIPACLRHNYVLASLLPELSLGVGPSSCCHAAGKALSEARNHPHVRRVQLSQRR